MSSTNAKQQAADASVAARLLTAAIRGVGLGVGHDLGSLRGGAATACLQRGGFPLLAPRDSASNSATAAAVAAA